ncbi:tyrosine--tRNA ligase [Candidatus Parcubacteria bacterium]|nr:tyrosine--tRNA ligase [Candidatus Parcubacteria bacterium]
MAKIQVDEKKIEEVLSRGVEKIYPNKETLKKQLLSGERIRLYCGFDPSADALHIGNAIALNKLSQLQELGHEVIFLIGDFTGMIGDPTDKSAARQKMSRKEVLDNSKLYKKQASAYLRFSGANPAKVMYNSKWSDKMSFKDLIEVSSNFTVQQMIQRDMFQERIKNEQPIYLHEFLYPLAQGYDSVAMDVDLEVGGNDQMFNMMCGRDLQKAINNKEKFVLTTKLLADDSGKKMGKSEGNAVFLNQEPADMYGAVMSWTDGVIGLGLELATKMPLDEVKEIQAQLKNDSVNPRDLKMKLAYEITALAHGEKAAKKAQEQFVKTFQKKDVPDEIETKNMEQGTWNIVELLNETGLVNSKGEARRLIKQGGIKVDGKVVSDDKQEVDLSQEKLIQRGKRQFLRVIKN